MRVLIVVVLVVAFVVGRRVYIQWQAGLQGESRRHPSIPSSLLEGADRTWVVFTTPYCATCEPIKRQLATADPGARVVSVDATREPALANAFHVRSAPTVFLADGAGEVQARLVGAAAVHDYVASSV